MSNPGVQSAAANLVQAIHWNYDDQTIASCAQQLVMTLGGQPHILDNLSPEGRLLYIITLVAAQP